MLTGNDSLAKMLANKMIADPKELYRRVSNGLAMSASEAYELEKIIRDEISFIRQRADALEAQLNAVQHHARRFYEAISAERDEALK